MGEIRVQDKRMSPPLVLRWQTRVERECRIEIAKAGAAFKINEILSLDTSKINEVLSLRYDAAGLEHIEDVCIWIKSILGQPWSLTPW